MAAGDWYIPQNGTGYNITAGDYTNITITVDTGASYYGYRFVATTSASSYIDFDSSHTSSWISETVEGKDYYSFSLRLNGVAATSSAVSFTIQWQGTNSTAWTLIESRTYTVNVEAAQTPTITSLPDWATGLTYTGGNLNVFTGAGTVTGGTFRYGLGSSTSSAPTTWKSDYTDVTVQSAGEYFLWYKVVGNAGYSDLPPAYLHRVEVAKADQTFEFETPIEATVLNVTSASPSGNFAGTWSVTVLDQSICAATINNNVLYITGTAVGTTRIDITCSGNANYNSRTVQIYVNVKLGALVYYQGHWYKAIYYDPLTTRHVVTQIKIYS